LRSSLAATTIDATLAETERFRLLGVLPYVVGVETRITGQQSLT
jgi:hypothetical protein